MYKHKADPALADVTALLANQASTRMQRGSLRPPRVVASTACHWRKQCFPRTSETQGVLHSAAGDLSGDHETRIGDVSGLREDALPGWRTADGTGPPERDRPIRSCVGSQAVAAPNRDLTVSHTQGVAKAKPTKITIAATIKAVNRLVISGSCPKSLSHGLVDCPIRLFGEHEYHLTRCRAK